MSFILLHSVRFVVLDIPSLLLNDACVTMVSSWWTLQEYEIQGILICKPTVLLNSSYYS